MADTFRIPFNKPWLAGRELQCIADVIRDGHASGDGAYTKKCSAVLEQALGAPKVLLSTSCTHALEMIALLLNIEPGDEIVVPSFTFVSTANAFVLRGAKPTFVDIRPDTFNLDESRLGRFLTRRTRAIVAMHYAGVGCEMDTILRLAESHGVAVVEDNAHGLFGKYKNKLLGTFGCLAAQSFHETKNFSCGEGGALVINDPDYIERAEVIREKGTDRSRFFRGQLDKYTWVDLGSSYLPSDILAAFLYAQLEARERIQTKRRFIWEYYFEHLRGWAGEREVRLHEVPPHCEQPYHLFCLVMPSRAKRDALIGHLRSRGILSVFHYVPLHLSPMGRRFGGKEGDCPVTEEVSERLLRLPFYNDLTEEDLQTVVREIQSMPW